MLSLKSAIGLIMVAFAGFALVMIVFVDRDKPKRERQRDLIVAGWFVWLALSCSTFFLEDLLRPAAIAFLKVASGPYIIVMLFVQWWVARRGRDGNLKGK